jgi:hypothetical protein
MTHTKYHSTAIHHCNTVDIFLLWSSDLGTMSTLATQKATTQTVLDAYNAWDMEKILAFRAPDCKQQVLPASMGRPSMSNSEYRERLNQILPCFRSFTVTHTEFFLRRLASDWRRLRLPFTQRCMMRMRIRVSCMRRVQPKLILGRMQTNTRWFCISRMMGRRLPNFWNM